MRYFAFNSSRGASLEDDEDDDEDEPPEGGSGAGLVGGGWMASVRSEVFGGVEGDVTVSCFTVGESVAGEEGEETTIAEVLFAAVLVLVVVVVSPSSFFSTMDAFSTFSVAVVVMGASSAFTGDEEGASGSIGGLEGSRTDGTGRRLQGGGKGRKDTRQRMRRKSQDDFSFLFFSLLSNTNTNTNTRTQTQEEKDNPEEKEREEDGLCGKQVGRATKETGQGAESARDQAEEDRKGHGHLDENRFHKRQSELDVCCEFSLSSLAFDHGLKPS